MSTEEGSGRGLIPGQASGSGYSSESRVSLRRQGDVVEAILNVKEILNLMFLILVYF